jgi:hypothetical protein
MAERAAQALRDGDGGGRRGRDRATGICRRIGAALTPRPEDANPCSGFENSVL